MRSSRPRRAAVFIADLIADEDMNTDDEKPLIGEPDDFSRFIAQHNWKGPRFPCTGSEWAPNMQWTKLWPKLRADRERYEAATAKLVAS